MREILKKVLNLWVVVAIANIFVEIIYHPERNMISNIYLGMLEITICFAVAFLIEANSLFPKPQNRVFAFIARMILAYVLVTIACNIIIDCGIMLPKDSIIGGSFGNYLGFLIVDEIMHYRKKHGKKDSAQ
jgi:hypothetical protein